MGVSDQGGSHCYTNGRMINIEFIVIGRSDLPEMSVRLFFDSPDREA